MRWLSSFIKVLKKIVTRENLKKLLEQVKKYGPEIIKIIRLLGPRVRDWWSGKKIAVIGPTSVGKTSFFRRLKGELIPEEHVETRGMEKVGRFAYRQTLPDGKEFKVSFKRCIDVGGDIAARKRAWIETCKNSDIIIYIITLEQLKRKQYRPRCRVYNDLRWIATHLKDTKSNTLVHFLVNKIDTELPGADKADEYENFVKKMKPKIDEFEQTAKKIFGSYKDRLTGITPTSMKDEHIYAISFVVVLVSVYEAVHR